MDALTIISLVASLISVALGIFAIWISIKFFEMSSRHSEAIKESERDIGEIVERLEQLFDRLYSDTFSLMRDTVSDMRRHIWPELIKEEDVQSQQLLETKLSELREDIGGRIEHIVEHKTTSQTDFESTVSELRALVSRAIEESGKVRDEAIIERIRSSVRNAIRNRIRRGREPYKSVVIERLSPIFGERMIEEEIQNMIDRGELLIRDDGSPHGPAIRVAS